MACFPEGCASTGPEGRIFSGKHVRAVFGARVRACLHMDLVSVCELPSLGGKLICTLDMNGTQPHLGTRGRWGRVAGSRASCPWVSGRCGHALQGPGPLGPGRFPACERHLGLAEVRTAGRAAGRAGGWLVSPHPGFLRVGLQGFAMSVSCMYCWNQVVCPLVGCKGAALTRVSAGGGCTPPSVFLTACRGGEWTGLSEARRL